MVGLFWNVVITNLFYTTFKWTESLNKNTLTVKWMKTQWLIKENSAKCCKIIQHLTTNFIKKKQKVSFKFMSLGQGFCQKNFSRGRVLNEKYIGPEFSLGMMTTGQMDTCIAGLMYKCCDIVLVFYCAYLYCWMITKLWKTLCDWWIKMVN